jgi:hypothetical protein
MSYKQFITKLEDDILFGKAVRRYFLFFIYKHFFFAQCNSYEVFSNVHLPVKYIFLSFVLPLVARSPSSVIFESVVRPSVYNCEDYTTSHNVEQLISYILLCHSM